MARLEGAGYSRTVFVVTGSNFPDALAGGVMQGRSKSVMLLVAPTGLDDKVLSVLHDHGDAILEVRFLGGTGAIPQSIRDTITDALR